MVSAYRITLKSLARRCVELHDEIADLDAPIGAIVDELAPALMAQNSIGHESAAKLPLTAGDNAERLQEINSAVVDSSKTVSRVGVDTYQAAAKNVFDLQRQMVGAARVAWVRDAATTQIQFAEDVTNAWVKAARELLK